MYYFCMKCPSLLHTIQQLNHNYIACCNVEEIKIHRCGQYTDLFNKMTLNTIIIIIWFIYGTVNGQENTVESTHKIRWKIQPFRMVISYHKFHTIGMRKHV